MQLAPFRRRYGSPLARLQDSMNVLFEGFFESRLSEQAWAPALEVTEQKDAIVVKAELPGTKVDDIELSVQDNTLIVSGEKKEESQEEHKGYFRSERHYGMFQRVIPLPSNVEAGKIQATSKDGVLTITLPKAETAKPKRIPIKSE